MTLLSRIGERIAEQLSELRRRISAAASPSDLRAKARHAEARGQLEEATGLLLEAELPHDAARLLALRAELANTSSERIRLLMQALAYAPDTSKPDLRRRLALL